MSDPNRPLSPHLQVYRPQLTSILSITHRATGIALTLGTVLLTWWLVAAATGPQAFDLVRAVMGSWIGTAILVGFTWALFYHLGNGVRHLFWDAGLGLDLRTTYRSGWACLLVSIAATAGAWAVGCAG